MSQAEFGAPGTPAYHSLVAVTGAATGGTFALGKACNNFSVHLIPGGTVTALDVTLQLSNDGTHFINVGAHITATGQSLSFYTNSPALYALLLVNTLTGTNPTLDGWICGY